MLRQVAHSRILEDSETDFPEEKGEGFTQPFVCWGCNGFGLKWSQNPKSTSNYSRKGILSYIITGKKTQTVSINSNKGFPVLEYNMTPTSQEKTIFINRAIGDPVLSLSFDHIIPNLS